MHLTRFSDIGLRLLMYLARETRALPAVTVAEVASQFNIPRNHLVKVTGLLARHGYIEAIRGRSGGLRLARAPELLRIGEIVRVLEGPKQVIECERLQCRLSKDCGLRQVLGKAYDAFFIALDAYTLADIIEGSAGMQISRMHKDYLQIHLSQAMAR